MIAGGLSYTLTELGELPALPRYSSGFRALDDLTGGGLVPGAVWTVAGPPGIGVTTLVTELAVHAAATVRVALANEHIATHQMRDLLLSIAAVIGLHRDAVGRIEVASWIPLPDPGCDDETWFGAGYDVLIIDCYDEMLRPRAWPTGLTALRAARWLRELARRTNTAVVLTARADRPAMVGRPAFEESWHGHWVRPLFDDVAGLRLELSMGKNGVSSFHATARGVGQAAGVAFRRGDGTTGLQRA